MKISLKKVSLSIILALTLTAGYAIGADGWLSMFKDADTIPDWAKSSVNNLTSIEVFKGRGNEEYGSKSYGKVNFDPNETVTRAELAVILDRYDLRRNPYAKYGADYIDAMMNLSYFEDTDLDFAVKMALALAMDHHSPIKAPSSENNYVLIDSVCEFSDEKLADTTIMKKIISKDIPQSYAVYYCDNNIMYGGGYFVHHTYSKGYAEGDNAPIDQWYGSFSPNILLSE